MHRTRSGTDGHTEGRTDRRRDSAITICLPKFLWGHNYPACKELKNDCILIHLACRVNAKKSVIYQTIIHSFERARKVCFSWRHLLLENGVIHGVRWCNIVFTLKGVTNTHKRMRHSLGIGGTSSVQWRKVGRHWRLQMCFRHLLCVRMEINQLQCVNCWIIIHCLSVSCTKITLVKHSWFDLLYNWPPNSELHVLHNNSLLKLTYFLTLKVPITTAADDKFCDIFPNFRKNNVWYFMRIICQQTILMKYHDLFLKMRQNLKLSPAANYRWRFKS